MGFDQLAGHQRDEVGAGIQNAVAFVHAVLDHGSVEDRPWKLLQKTGKQRSLNGHGIGSSLGNGNVG
jgi:hypothetical protein